ncbi:MAG: proton-conducting membrane transporter, partial [Proteobacteria bacterium]|nr:proton-conducting membrane transporter [Pseudomonadota bacterium]
DQSRIVSADSGQIHPADLTGYESVGGLQGIKLALKRSPEQIIADIKLSRLRGRGGAGFPTGEKWETVQTAPGNTKIVICNGDEGDPGAFMDRMLLESHPFRVIEGMLIGAYAVGAHQGFIYIREEYPLAVERIRQAIVTCRKAGVLGRQVMGHDFRFDLRLVEGAGAFVCGEETALIASLEGRRGVPRPRPPYPSQQGFNRWPTLVNNVETFANIPWIMARGAERFGSFGTESSRGTKIFALAGKIKRGGLIEVPMGTSLRAIVDDRGGGVAGGRKLKAVLVGGPSGGCLPEHLLDVPVDYEQLQTLGCMMGSGGLVVLDQHDCMVDVARYFLEFTAGESCGKCAACRIGSQRLLEILDRLCLGKGEIGDLEKLETLCELMRQGSQCGLGRSIPNPVRSTLKYFRREYMDHLDKHCPAGKCVELFTFKINQNCTGCTLCYRACSEGAIAFAPWERAEIDPARCTRCGMCRLACAESAIEVSR